MRLIRLPDGFYSKPLWQRSLVILAGPVMSFLLRLFRVLPDGCHDGHPDGQDVLTKDQSWPEPGGEGHRIGLRMPVTSITAIDGKPVTDGEADGRMRSTRAWANKPLSLTVRPRWQIAHQRRRRRSAALKDEQGQA